MGVRFVPVGGERRSSDLAERHEDLECKGNIVERISVNVPRSWYHLVNKYLFQGFSRRCARWDVAASNPVPCFLIQWFMLHRNMVTPEGAVTLDTSSSGI